WCLLTLQPCCWNSAGGAGVEPGGRRQAADGRVSEPLLPHIVRSPAGAQQALGNMKKKLAREIIEHYHVYCRLYCSCVPGF
uniref:Uncharacterized protein n=1 Tax=Aegilops tauschii subsp. strangulata TaxID=200361 RepID=A0A453AMN2_AEGTS